jgi:voltage-gated potassium channel
MSAWTSFRRRTCDLFEGDPGRSIGATFIHGGLLALVVINVVAAVCETVPSIATEYRRSLAVIETVSLVVFVTEFLLRLWASREDPVRRKRGAVYARWRWLLSPAGIVDFLSASPFVIAALTTVDLRVLGLLRLLSIFKLARYSPGFRSLMEAIRIERHALAACLVILGVAVLVAATGMYIVERDVQPDKFGTVPDAMWWAVTTITTVGYGDVVPVSALGRVVGAATMIVGLVMLALPIAIIATSFARVIARNEFVATGGMIARMPLFSGLDTHDVMDLLPSISTRTFDPGEVILRKGEPVRALHLIAIGEIELERGRQRCRFGPGDAFGGHHDDLAAMLAVRAVKRSRLLIVEEHDVLELCDRMPGLAERITALIDREPGSGLKLSA